MIEDLRSEPAVFFHDVDEARITRGFGETKRNFFSPLTKKTMQKLYLEGIIMVNGSGDS